MIFIYAQILHGLISNTIVLNNPDLVYQFNHDDKGHYYECVLRIDNIKPQPGIGWKANCKTHKFMAPKK
jgi:hypothetical protein